MFLESCWSLIHDESLETLVLISGGISGSIRVNHLDSKREGQASKAGRRSSSAIPFDLGCYLKVLTPSSHIDQGDQDSSSGGAPRSGDSNLCQAGTKNQP